MNYAQFSYTRLLHWRSIILIGLTIFLSNNIFVFAQQSPGVGINNANPDTSAIFDVVSTNRGILIPRMTTSERDAIIEPATGLLIFNTDDRSFYFNRGNPFVPNWESLRAPDSWLTRGNSNKYPPSNYIGTNDSVDWLIRTDSIERITITADGKVGVGTTFPTTELQLIGTLSINDGTEGDDHVLVSDAFGATEWKEMAVGFLVQSDLGQSIPRIQSTKVDFSMEIFNDGGYFSITSDDYSAPDTGVYAFSAGVTLQDLDDNSRFMIEIRINNTPVARKITNPTANSFLSASISITLRLNLNDLVDIYIYHDSNASRTISTNPIDCWFSGHRIY